jgi:hypothetical protein
LEFREIILKNNNKPKKKKRTEKVNQFLKDNNNNNSGNSGSVGNDDGDVQFHKFVLTYNATPMKPGKAFSLAMTKILGKPISQGIFRKIFETGAHDASLTNQKRQTYSEYALYSAQVAKDYYVCPNSGDMVCFYCSSLSAPFYVF